MIAIDCETYKTGPGRAAPRLVCVSISTDDGATLYHQADDWIEPFIAALRGEELVNHALAFDLAVLIAELRRRMIGGSVSRAVFGEVGDLVGRLYADERARCTYVLAILMAIARGEPVTANNRRRSRLPAFDLGSLCEAYLGEGPSGKSGPDVWRTRYHELVDVPIADWPASAVEYATADPVWAGRLYRSIRDAVGGHRLRAEARHTRAAWCQQLAGAWGVRTDGEIARTLAQHLDREISDGYALIRAAIGRNDWLRDDGSRNMAAMAARVESVLSAGGQWDPTPGGPCVTEKGRTRTDRLTLESCAALGAVDLGAYAAIGASLTDRSTFVDTIRAGETLPIHARWFPLVESGRLSCRSPNLTNQPARDVEVSAGRRIGIRQGFVPRPGFVFAAADYATAELRAFSQTALEWFGASAMADALQAEAAAVAAGRPALDLHSRYAARILGIGDDDAIARRTSNDPSFDAVRQLAKRINFGCLGMMGASTFLKTCEADGFDLTLGGRLEGGPVVVADRLLAVWRETWPEVPRYFDRVLADLRRTGGSGFRAVSTGDGLIRGSVGAADGANHYFQNRVAQWIKDAWFVLSREAYNTTGGPFSGCRPVIVPHDEIIAEVPEHRAHEAAERLAAVMHDTAAANCPDVPIVVEPALMRRWYKGAKTLRDGAGRLVVWEGG